MQPQEANQIAVYDGMSVKWKPAPLGKRVLALALDLAIVQLLTGAFLLAVIFLAGGSALSLIAIFDKSALKSAGPVAWLVPILIVLLGLAVLTDGYFIYTEWKWGATPGKRALGLKVISAKGGRLTFGQCCLRDMLRWVDLGLLIPGVLSVSLTAKRQRLGDLVAGTLVSYSRQEENKRNFLYVTQELYQWFLEKCSPSPLLPEDCDAYLRFSYPAFVLASRTFQPAEFAAWEDFALLRVGALKDLEVDQVTKLRLFAELCFQTRNADQGK